MQPLRHGRETLGKLPGRPRTSPEVPQHADLPELNGPPHPKNQLRLFFALYMISIF